MINRSRRRAFTLVELLVVILIILAVSAVALPTVIPAISHRQVSEAARILQAGLVSARDIAINTNAPAGIRLLPDPTLISVNSTSVGNEVANQIDPTKVLASNRFIPIQFAPDYSEGFVSPWLNQTVLPGFTATFPYQLQPAGQVYPSATNAMLYLIEVVQFNNNGTPQLNPPTSWYWNIRIGDKIQINGTGVYYTVVGPMTTPNAELFVNVGPPGTLPPLTVPQAGGNVNPEFLFLVNGLDDNKDGFVDNGWDGVDNDGDGYVDQVLNGPNSEWVNTATNQPIETETWAPALRTATAPQPGFSYTVTRRPSPAPGSRETALPSNVVIDLTGWNPQYLNVQLNVNYFVSERSRLPVDPISGFVDILLYPNGQVLPTTLYSNPASFGMGSTFYHFWLAERADLFDPLPLTGVPYLLPMPAGSALYPKNPPDNTGRALTGDRRLLSLNTRTGQIVTNSIEIPVTPGDSGFDGTNPSRPFLGAQQGLTGDSR
jgi:prepilin-type N-terminal cleavage/methylation domain-containing protein